VVAFQYKLDRFNIIKKWIDKMMVVFLLIGDLNGEASPKK